MRRRRAQLDALPDTTWQPARRRSRLPRWIPRPLRGAIRFLGKSIIWLVVVSLLVALFYLCLSFRYDLNRVGSMPERTIILDTKGRELAALHGENRRVIPRSQVPDHFVSALLAREDKRFYDHHGVDYLGLLRASFRNLRDGSFTQGASTLTMQLARNTYVLWDRSLHRKLLEIALAFRIEMHFTKDEILTCYVNRIYFGSGCHGLEEASRRYFGCSADELNPNQAALLAGIIRAPHAFSPLRNLDGALRQRDEVLIRMMDEQFISSDRAEEIRQLPLGLTVDSPPSTGSFAGQAVRRHFEELLASENIARGGLQIRSSINANLQFLLESELQKLKGTIAPNLQLAGVCVDPQDGGILAIVGGRRPNNGTFNRALDARRGLGPVFAPFLLAALAERGYQPDPDNLFADGRKLGVAEASRLLERFGFSGPFSSGEDLFRGNLATTPLELATAIATLCNEGQRPRTFLLREIKTPHGTTVFSNRPLLTPAFSPQAAALALGAQFSDPENLTLTGLSLSRSDAWALYFGSRHALCVWIGLDQPDPLSDTSELLDSLEDSIAALAIEFNRRP